MRESYRYLSQFYDRLIGRDVDYEKWATYYTSFFDRTDRKIKKIADIGCGTGSLTIELAKQDYRVYGIDLSSEMLEIASEKARRAQVNIMFTAQDIREVELTRVDACIMSLDVLNYIELDEIKKVAERIYSLLPADGLLLFDISSEYKLRNVLSNNLYYEDYDDLTYFWKNTLYNNKVDMELTFFSKEGELYRRYDDLQTQYIHSCEDIISIFREAGFETEAYSFMSSKSPEEKDERIFFYNRKKRIK